MKLKLKSLKDLKKECGDHCFNSTRTVWWASRWDHLQKGPVPLDIFGAPLFQNENTDQFFDENKIRAHSESYGKYPVTTWTAAHHENLSQIGEAFPGAFPGKLEDVSSGFAHFARIIEGLVDAGKIPNLDEAVE